MAGEFERLIEANKKNLVDSFKKSMQALHPLSARVMKKAMKDSLEGGDMGHGLMAAGQVMRTMTALVPKEVEVNVAYGTYEERAQVLARLAARLAIEPPDEG